MDLKKLMGILKKIGVDWKERRLLSNLYMKQPIKVRMEKKCQREEKMEGGTVRMSSIAYILQHTLGRFNEELFPEHGGRST